MKKTLLLLLFIAAFFNSLAQSDKQVEKGLLKVNALLPGASYELGAGRNTTFNFDVALVPGGGTDYYGNSRFGLFIGAQAEFRYFANFNRRLSKGKNIDGNSGNYWALNNQILIGNPLVGTYYLDNTYNHIVAITYGIQRTRPKGFYWNVSFGPGVGISESDAGGAIMIDVKLGWVVKKIR
ncbi:MAG: hypothetical protein CML04_08095 [Pseudozobellia sp.]|nr:hypothetical protein [Pseudozobellia sp.]|tara:strand:+ start:39 stop:581 length:543 start_codon:yes stop_codon:yes gene_type:complete